MKPGPVSAARLITRFLAIDAGPIQCVDLLALIIVEMEWRLDPIEAAELAERWCNRFIAQARAIYNEACQNGQPPTFGFNSVTPYYIQGFCYCEPSDNDAVKLAKQKRAQSCTVQGSFDVLTPPEFEKLCGKVLSLIGVAEPIVTQSSNDQGVDFYGKLALGRFISPTVLPAGAENQLEVWLVGQAKHYQRTRISTADIRELVWSITLARSGTYASMSNPLSGLEIRICDPVFFLFFTTGQLSTDSRRLLQRSGVIGMDGVQLSTFLSDHGVAQKDGIFDCEEFRNWLQECERKNIAGY